MLALDKSPRTVRDMFAGVAPRYDLLNHLLSGSLDRLWRRRAAAALAVAPGAPVLDLCCGTGDQALAVARRGARVVAADFCLPMLARARGKYARSGDGSPLGIAADALDLPLPTGSFAGCTVAFGLRNLTDLDAGLTEIRRVLRAGGRIALLEFALPRGPLLRRLYLLYFRHLLPRIGALVSPRGEAYGYLRDSVLAFPQRDELAARMARAGFSGTTWRDLAGGIVCLYTGSRAA